MYISLLLYFTHRRLDIITFIIDLMKYNTHTFSAEQKRTSVLGSPFEHDILSVTFCFISFLRQQLHRREEQHVPNRRAVGQQHHEPIDADAKAARWW